MRWSCHNPLQGADVLGLQKIEELPDLAHPILSLRSRNVSWLRHVITGTDFYRSEELARERAMLGMSRLPS